MTMQELALVKKDGIIGKDGSFSIIPFFVHEIGNYVYI